MTLTFDLQNLTRLSVGTSGYFSEVSSETAQAVYEIWYGGKIRYRTNKTTQNKQ